MKQVSFTLLLCLFLLQIRGVAYAGQEIITKEDISKLLIDESKEVPEYKIIPPPAPLPPPTDDRSWAKSPYRTIIEEVAQRYHLDPQIIYATIMTESDGEEFAFRYEPHIQDASLCMGQVLINTARSLGFNGNPKELYNPSICIDLIGKYLRKLLDTYGNLTPVQLATAYNTGSPYRRPAREHIFRFKKWLDENS